MNEAVVEAASSLGWRVDESCTCAAPEPVIVGGARGEIGFYLPGRMCRSCRAVVGDPTDGPLAAQERVSGANSASALDTWAELAESALCDCPTQPV